MVGALCCLSTENYQSKIGLHQHIQLHPFSRIHRKNINVFESDLQVFTGKLIVLQL